VFAFESETGKPFVIECLLIFKPSERELPAIMFQMTSNAIYLRRRRVICPPVIPLTGVDPPLDFRMTFQAFKTSSSATEIVAGAAFRGALQLLVRFRQRPGGNLGINYRAAQKEQQDPHTPS